MNDINALVKNRMDTLVTAALNPNDKSLYKEATRLHSLGECLKYIFSFGFKDPGQQRLKTVINSLSRALSENGFSPLETLHRVVSVPSIPVRFTIDEAGNELQGEYDLYIEKENDAVYVLVISDGDSMEPLTITLDKAQFFTGINCLNTLHYLEKYDFLDARQHYIETGKVDLSGENLSQINMECMDLRNANLTGANLSGVNLTGANFSEVNLTKTILSDSNLTTEQLLGTSLVKDNFCSDKQIEAANILHTMMQSSNEIYCKYNELFNSLKGLAIPERKCQFAKKLIENSQGKTVSYSIDGSIIADESIVHYTMHQYAMIGINDFEKDLNDRVFRLFLEKPEMYESIIPADSKIRKIKTMGEWHEMVNSNKLDLDMKRLLARGFRDTNEYRNFVENMREDLGSLGFTSYDDFFEIIDKTLKILNSLNVSKADDAELVSQYKSFYNEFPTFIGMVCE